MNRKEFIFTVIVTFLVVMVWIIADLIHTRPSVSLDPNLKNVLEPLSPEFDPATMDKIKNYSPNPIIIENTPIQPSPSPSPSPSPLTSLNPKIASPSAIIP